MQQKLPASCKTQGEEIRYRTEIPADYRPINDGRPYPKGIFLEKIHAGLFDKFRNRKRTALFFHLLNQRGGNLAAGGTGIHGLLLNQPVGFRLGHAAALDQQTLGPVHQTQLGQFIG